MSKQQKEKPNQTYYVRHDSKSKKRDGKTLKTAWSSFDEIDWNKINKGDTIMSIPPHEQTI